MHPARTDRVKGPQLSPVAWIAGCSIAVVMTCSPRPAVRNAWVGVLTLSDLCTLI
jgi:hypothetical protein